MRPPDAATATATPPGHLPASLPAPPPLALVERDRPDALGFPLHHRLLTMLIRAGLAVMLAIFLLVPVLERLARAGHEAEQPLDA